MRKFLALLFVMLFLPHAAYAQERFVPQNTGLLDASIKFTGTIRASDTLNELNFSIYALPVGAISYDASTAYAAVSDAQNNRLLTLKWKDVAFAPYEITADVRNRAKFQGAKRVPFPYTPPLDALRYLDPTLNSPVAPEIRDKAVALTQGAENGFEAVTALSTWIFNNIKYDTAYADAIYPADAVFRNRAGVCAEFTNLMVSMSRAVGIPARSVAGVIYSRDGWGYHAWAEVYLDGWVPVDPTWNEIGWLDAAHVELATFADGGDVKMTAFYKALGKRTISFDQPSITVGVRSTEPISHVFDTQATTFPQRIGIGDSAVVEVKTRNAAAGCIATSTDVVSRVDGRGTKVVEVTNPISIAVCPDETSHSHFVLKTRSDLDSRFVYSSLADIKTFLGDDITADLTVDPSEKRRSQLDLSIGSTSVKRGDRVRFDVATDAQDFEVYSDLPIIGSDVIAQKTGQHYIIAATSTGEVERKEITVLEDLPFRISNVARPASVTCGQQFNLTFEIQNLKPFFQDIGVETIVGEELQAVPSSSLHVDKDATTSVTIATRVGDQCSGKDQFVSVAVGDQRVHEFIDVEKKRTFAETISSFANRVLDELRALISAILDAVKSL
ncbi:MAG: transglutaminase domain-containing protein [Candidatus Aenigmarchaeota archaeon]|nr:transglutaminase domain-containing protein [Candidatus Aenigmarchaeota archaeon]